MTTRFLSLSSGSSGNCYYIGNEECSILIDAGVSLRRLRSRFKEMSLSIDDIGAILVTHDHLDHIRHLGSITDRYKKPIYTTPVLCNALRRHSFTAGVVEGCLRSCPYDADTTYRGVTFRPLRVPHDATETVGYNIDFYGEKILVLTDLGRVTDEAVKAASSCDHLVIESNYDFDMLLQGPYTKELKSRIMGENGHLCNDDCASFVKRVYHNGLKHIFLCHISDNNNTPKAAYECTSRALKGIGVEPGKDVVLYPLPRKDVSMMMEL